MSSEVQGASKSNIQARVKACVIHFTGTLSNCCSCCARQRSQTGQGIANILTQGIAQPMMQ